MIFTLQNIHESKNLKSESKSKLKKNFPGKGKSIGRIVCEYNPIQRGRDRNVYNPDNNYNKNRVNILSQDIIRKIEMRCKRIRKQKI